MVDLLFWKTPKLLRDGFLKSVELFDGPKTELKSVEDIEIKLEGRSLKARIYRNDTDAGLKPGLLFFHGGGFVIGNIDTHDRFCRKIAKQSNHSIISVDYRKGPEHIFPAAFEDAVDCWKWLQENAANHHIDPARISLSGDSAGAAMCLLAATRASKMDTPHQPAGLALIYPPLTSHPDTKSRALLTAEKIVLTQELLDWFNTNFTGGEIDTAHPHMHPFHDVKGENLPRCLVLTCGLDPLRDEGDLIVAKMKEHGAEVVHKEYSDMYHGFITASAVLPQVQTVIEDISSFLTMGASAEKSSEDNIAAE